MVYIIDRFEGEIAVLEHDGILTDFLREKLPEHAHEGDLLEWSGDGWQILHDDTDPRRKALAERRRQMLEGNQS